MTDRNTYELNKNMYKLLGGGANNVAILLIDN